MPTSRHFLARWSPIALLASLVLALTTCWSAVPAQGVASYTLWSRSAPTTLVIGNETVGIELGNKFTAVVGGQVTHVRFYKTSVNTGTHIGSLWDSSGRRLASVTFTGETSSGWQVAKFATPVSVKAGSTYMVSYFAPKGRYAATNDFYGAPANPKYLTFTPGSQAFYSYGSASLFPRTTAYRHSEYWVDLEFVPSATVPPAPVATATPTPTQTTTAPATVPTSTTTSTAPASTTNCAADPSRCGYPDADNTGVPAGKTLRKVPAELKSGPGWQWNSYLGSVQTTAAGAVMDGLDVAGGVVIDHPNATLSNSKVSNCGGSWDSDVVAVRYRAGNASYQGSGAKITRNTLFGTPSGCTIRARSGVRDIYGEAPNVTVSGNNISGTGNGVTVEYQGLIADNYVHHLGHIAGDHHSGISTHGGALQVTVRHNTVLLYGMPQPGGGGVSAALTIYSDFGHAQNTTLESNLISGGAYTIFAGNSGDSYAGVLATNIKVLSNRFVCGQWDYGPVAFYKPATGNAFSGNYCDQSLAGVSA